MKRGALPRYHNTGGLETTVHCCSWSIVILLDPSDTELGWKPLGHGTVVVVLSCATLAWYFSYFDAPIAIKNPILVAYII